MPKIISILSILFITSLTSCEENKVKGQDNLEGTWIFQEFFLGDAIMLGCGWEGQSVRTIYIEIEKAENGFEISGNAPVNQYFGSFELLSFDDKLNRGKIKMSAIGSTKMAGPEPLMQCENMYFNMLEEANDFGFSQSGELQIGRFRTPESNPRDGGTYMVFEKAKLE